MMRWRHHPAVMLLSILALCAQVLLPVTHAMRMAQLDASTPNLVFCAPGTDGGKSARLAAIAASDLFAQHGKLLQHKPSCSICASAHAAQLALPFCVGLANFHLPESFLAAVPERPLQLSSRVQLPPSRGPPRYS